jgi:hypothetical protein
MIGGVHLRDPHTLTPFSHPQTIVRGLPLAPGGACAELQ